jgi:hypothetical protein
MTYKYGVYDANPNGPYVVLIGIYVSLNYFISIIPLIMKGYREIWTVNVFKFGEGGVLK